jgi:hypothetical protein
MGGEEAGGSGQPRGIPQFYQCISRLLILGLFTFPFVFEACSSEQQGGKAELLGERVKGFWEARVAGDDIKAYNYEAYSKTGKMTLQQYIGARNPALKYTAYEVKGVVEKGDEATVSVGVQYNLVIPARADLNLSTTIDERWARIDGQWYRQLEQPATG